MKKLSSSRMVELFKNAQHIFCICYFLIENVLCSELIICCYNVDIKNFLPPKVIIGYELIAKMKLIC